MGGTSNSGEATARAPGRRKRVLFRLAALLLGLVAALAAAELALRSFPAALLGADLAGAMYDPYNTTPLGIYFWEPLARMNLMWPSQELRACSHGYAWTHRTDARGFRNPPDRQATEILLLGDSIIYGHGVEEDETAAHLLHREYGHPVYNMARQGDCLYQHYRLLRLYLDELKPRTVLLFAFSNDLADLAKTDALERPDRPPEIDGYDYAEIRRSIARRAAADRPAAPFLSRFALGRLAAVWKAPAQKAPKKGAGKERKLARSLRALAKLGLLPPDGKPVDAELMRRIVSLPQLRDKMAGSWRELDAAELERARRYYRTVLPDLHRRCRERGATLVLVNLALDQGEFWRGSIAQDVAALVRDSGVAVTDGATRVVEDAKYDARARMAAQVGEAVAAVAREDRIDYLDLSARFLAADDYLEGDGHLSELGHRRLAELLHGYLSRARPPAQNRE